MSVVQILVCAYIVKLINLLLCCMMVHANPAQHFLYFAYGSNLLKRRVSANNPSAEFLGIGRLEKHQLDFVKYHKPWRGAVATIVPNDKENVWGAVWKMHNDYLCNLDKLEQVDIKEFSPKLVDIIMINGCTAQCRTYQNRSNPPCLDPDEILPEDRRPSETYKQYLLKGAIECNLPKEYISKLRLIPSNGQYATPSLRALLNLM